MELLAILSSTQLPSLSSLLGDSCNPRCRVLDIFSKLDRFLSPLSKPLHIGKLSLSTELFELKPSLIRVSEEIKSPAKPPLSRSAVFSLV